MSIIKGVSPKKYSCGHYSTGTLYGLNKKGEPICEECVKKQEVKCKCPPGYHQLFTECRGY
jgi:hypothetical protein